MDPLAAWKELLDALTEMDWERVLETAETGEQDVEEQINQFRRRTVQFVVRRL